MEQGLEPEMLKAPKKLPHPDQKTRAFDLKYERYIDREDVRNASFNLKKFIGAETIILAVLAAVLIYMVLYNLNRGDNIFANGMYDGTGTYFMIPYGAWHAWLQNLSWTLGIIAGVCIAIIVSSLIAYGYYRSQLIDREMDEFTSAASQAERDIEFRKAFKEKYASLYEDIIQGRVSITASRAAASQEPTVIKAQSPLPQIKTPPKISITPPGMVTIPASGAPPVPDDIIKKKKVSGPVEGEKRIYVRCERCNKTLNVNIPKKLVLNNELEVVPISIVHGEGDDQHVLTVYLDPDFKSRRDRVSDILVLE
ncbi:MAG TPA: hypothetical protein VKM55_07010 [Candidatus Lokiarchaeia archaeon]|nr:hypothetical protein [Candidatus Lokiarchaeia archaeon]